MTNVGMWLGIVFLVFAGTLFNQALSYSYYSKIGPGPGLFPIWVSGLLVLLSIIYIIDCVRKDVVTFKDILPRGEGLRKVLVFFGALIFFLAIAPFSGYTVASILMLFALFLLDYRWYSALLISVLVTGAVVYVFRELLSVPLPVNIFGF